jgi:acyl carrier protein
MNHPVKAEDAVAGELLAYIKEEFLYGDPDGELTEDTPLLEYGILNSLRTVSLLAFARDRLGADLDGLRVDATTLATVRSLSHALSHP